MTDPNEPVSSPKPKWNRSKPSWLTQRTSRSDYIEVSVTGGVTQSKVKRPRPQDDTVEPAELSERSRFNLVHKFNTFFCSIQFFYIDCSVQKYLLPVRHG